MAGLSPARVRAAVAAGALMVLRPGIVMPTDEWQQAHAVARHLIRIDAALLAFPGSWISRDGHPVTSLVRTCIDVAARRSTGDALAVRDEGMRLTSATAHADVRRAAHSRDLRKGVRADFDRAVACYSRHRWVTTVRQAIRWAEPAAESRLESLSRSASLQAGLPTPEWGYPLKGDDGRLYWTAMGWEHRPLIGEVDGALTCTSPEVLIAEKRRSEALIGPERLVVRWGFPRCIPVRTSCCAGSASPSDRRVPRNGRDTPAEPRGARPCHVTRRKSTVGAVPKDDPHSGGAD